MATPKTADQRQGLLDDVHRQLAEETERRSKAEDMVEQYKELLADQVRVVEEEGEQRRHNQDIKMKEALSAKEKLENWKVGATQEYKQLEKSFGELKDWEQVARQDLARMDDNIDKGNEIVKQMRAENDDAKGKLAALTKERDNLKQERDAITIERNSLAKATATLQEELKAAKAAQQTQSQFEGATSNTQPQLNTHQQTTLQKSDSILNGLRASASVTQASPQQKLQQQGSELKYTQEDMNRCRVVAQQEQFELHKEEAQQVIIQQEQRFEVLKQEAFTEINKWKGLAQAGATSANIDINEALMLISRLTNENEQLDKQSWSNLVDKGRIFAEKMAVEEKLKEKDTECTRIREQLSSCCYDLTKATAKSEEHRQGWVGEQKLSNEMVLNKNREIRTLEVKVQDLEEEIKKREAAKAASVARVPIQAVAREADDNDIPGVVSLGVEAYPFLRPQAAAQPVSKPTPAPKPSLAEKTKTKKRKRRVDDEETQITQQVPWDNPPAATFFKTAAVVSTIGLVHVAKKRGWWF